MGMTSYKGTATATAGLLVLLGHFLESQDLPYIRYGTVGK
jgi:hypothetical protein